jgi:hypothetical protein
MSQLTSTVRAARPAIAAVERARLALVPVRRVDAPRAPFAVLVFLILGAGVVGLLMFNTQMQQDSFYATRLQHQADRLTAQQQSLQMDLDRQRDPQVLAQRARALHMVQPPVPAAIDLRTGRVVGLPTAATNEDAFPINPRTPSGTPAFTPKAKVVTVHATTPAKTGQTGAGDGPASTTNPPAAGTNKAGTAAPGATR